MSKTETKLEKEKSRLVQEKCLAMLNEMLRDEDNKYCQDCDAKGPRWASWNLGVFLCIRCAGIHRNLGVHISRVKSVNLDTWTPEQVVAMTSLGNSRARAVYEANLPDSSRRPQTDSALESFIRAKYEHKKYIAKDYVPPVIGKPNWDKEIEEMLKKKKKLVPREELILPNYRKKVQETGDLVGKPKNTIETPKAPVPEVVEQKTHDLDLLGLTLDTPCNADPFASPVKSAGELFLLETELTQPTQSSQMSKESIMSLYGKPPAQGIQGGVRAAAGSNPFLIQQPFQQGTSQFMMTNPNAGRPFQVPSEQQRPPPNFLN